MDNFGGAAAWDAYCEKQDEMLEYLMENTKCGDCIWCSETKCSKTGETINPEHYAVDYDCELVETF